MKKLTELLRLPGWQALSAVIRIFAPDPQSVIEELISGPTPRHRVRRHHTELCCWLYPGITLSVVNKNFTRLLTAGLDVAPAKAPAWLIFAAARGGLADRAAVIGLAATLGVPAPDQSLPARPLDLRYAEVHPLQPRGADPDRADPDRLQTPADQREALREAVVAWLHDLLAVRSGPGAGADTHRALDTALTVFFDAVDGRLLPPARAATPARAVAPARAMAPAGTEDRDLAELRRLVEGRTHLHSKTHMLHQWRHRETIRGLIDRQLTRGNHVLVAGLIVDVLPIYYVWQDFDARARQMLALAEAAHERAIPQAVRDQALIEGWGTNGPWRLHLDERTRLLDPDTLHRLRAARARAERGQSDRGGLLADTDARALIRRSLLTEAVRLRLAAADLQRRQPPPLQVRTLYREALHLAHQAHHESLEISLLLDAARYELEGRRVHLAHAVTQRAAALASLHGNHRRHVMALLEMTRIQRTRGDLAAAQDHLRHARMLFDTLQALPAGRRPPADWYQPGLRTDINTLAAQLKQDGGLDAWQVWWDDEPTER